MLATGRHVRDDGCRPHVGHRRNGARQSGTRHRSCRNASSGPPSRMSVSPRAASPDQHVRRWCRPCDRWCRRLLRAVYEARGAHVPLRPGGRPDRCRCPGDDRRGVRAPRRERAGAVIDPRACTSMSPAASVTTRTRSNVPVRSSMPVLSGTRCRVRRWRSAAGQGSPRSAASMSPRRRRDVECRRPASRS